MFLCNADPIPFLPFSHLSLLTFLSLLLHLLHSPGCFFALSRMDILSIWFENFFASLQLTHSPHEIALQSAPIHYRSLDLDMSQPSSQLWADFDLHMGLHCLHFFFTLASCFSFLGIFVTTRGFFLFSTSKTLSFFSLQGLFLFSQFKMQFCNICLRSRHTS